MLNKEVLIAVALSLMLVSLVAVFTPPLQYSDDIDIWTERTAYYWMAEEPFTQDRPDKANTGPWAYRVLTPTIVHFMPFDTITSYYLLNILVLIASGVLLFMLLRKLNFTFGLNLLGITLFLLSEWITRLVLHVNIYMEALVYFFIILCFYAMVTKRDWLFALAMVLGALNKEVILLMIPVYFFYKWKENSVKLSLASTALIAIVPLAVFILIHAFIPVLEWGVGGQSAGIFYHLSYFWVYLLERTASLEAFLLFLYHATFNTWGVLILLPLFNPKVFSYLRSNPHYLVYLILCFSLIAIAVPKNAIIAFPVMIILSLKGVQYINRKAIPILLLFHIFLSDTFGWFAALPEGMFIMYNTSKIVLVTLFMVWFLSDETMRRIHGKSEL